MRLSEASSGVFTVVTTPFTEDGALDIEGIGQLTEFYRNAGCNGMTLLGVMGEAPKLSSSETRALVTEAVQHAGDMQVIVGLAAQGLAQIHESAHQVMELGVSGVMVNASHTIKTDAQGLGFFKGVAKGLGDIPWCLQDFPLATGVQLPIETVERVIEDHPNCVMVKQENWPGWGQVAHMRRRSDAGEMRRVSILTGFGGLYFAEDLLAGSDGAMIGFSYPEMLVGMMAARDAGDTDRMYDIFDAYLPLLRCEMSLTTGLAVRKYVLRRRGALRSDTIRQPGPKLGDFERGVIDRLMDRLDAKVDGLGAS